MKLCKDNPRPIVFLTHVVNKTVIDGYLPAAVALGYSVYILTDQAIAHQTYFSGDSLNAYPTEIIACDVFNSHAVIELLLELNAEPAAIFSNSDHLQAACAQAATFFDLPSKDWKTCYRAKNKYAMRRYMQLSGLPNTWFTSLHSLEALQALRPPFPCVVKPQQGVASMDVQLCETAHQLEQYCRKYWQHAAGQALIIEEYIAGPVFTLETIGDGDKLIPLGGFDVEVSSPPHFIERNAKWVDGMQGEYRKQAFEQLIAFGIGFGSCHSEFVLTENGPRLIEINYRTIGGNKDFLLNRLSGNKYFTQVLKVYLGEKLPANLVIRGDAIAHYYTANKSGRIINQPKAFESEWPCFVQLQNLKNSGEYIEKSNSDRDRLSILIAHRAENHIDCDSLEKVISSVIKDLEWEIF